jgi:hypothetical protein
VCANGRVGQAHRMEPRAFPLWRPVSDERRQKRSHTNRKRKRHTKLINENEKRGWRGLASEGTKSISLNSKKRKK